MILLNRNTCCDEKLKLKNMVKKINHINTLSLGKGWYGGVIKWYCMIKCEKCGQIYYAFLVTKNGNYLIHNIGIDKVNEVCIVEEEGGKNLENIEEIKLSDENLKEIEKLEKESKLEEDLNAHALSIMSRNDLMSLAKRIKVNGNTSLMNNAKLIDCIKQKQSELRDYKR